MILGSKEEEEYFIEVAEGNIPNTSRFHKFGRAEAIGTGGADVWTPGTYRTWYTAAETLDVVSTSASDTSAGARARSITIQGLDGNFDEVEETISLNGLTPVTTTATFIRVNRAFVATQGTYGNIVNGNNLGVISISGNTTAVLVASIDAFRGQTEQTHYTVPNGKTLYISGMNMSGGNGAGFKCYLVQRPNADDTSVPVSPVKMVMDFRGDNDIYPPHFLKFAEKTDVWFIGLADTGTIPVYINWYGLLKTN